VIIIAGIPGYEGVIPENPFEERIILEKHRSPLLYYYETPDQVKFELKLRAEILKASQELYRSKVQFSDFGGSRCNPLYWFRTPNGGFQLVPGRSPSEAIRDIFVNSEMYSFECATAIVILLYKALLELFGPKMFDTYFGNLTLYTWTSDEDLRLITRPLPESFPGDVLYFRNPDVNPKTPEWQGENAVKLDDNLFYGHGAGIQDANGIIQILNNNRRPWSFRSAYLTKQVTYPDYKYLYQLQKNYVGSFADINYRCIVSRIGEFTSIAI
jgi:protein-glutamine gamma-glutamyltransferase